MFSGNKCNLNDCNHKSYTDNRNVCSYCRKNYHKRCDTFLILVDDNKQPISLCSGCSSSQQVLLDLKVAKDTFDVDLGNSGVDSVISGKRKHDLELQSEITKVQKKSLTMDDEQYNNILSAIESSREEFNGKLDSIHTQSVNSAAATNSRLDNINSSLSSIKSVASTNRSMIQENTREIRSISGKLIDSLLISGLKNQPVDREELLRVALQIFDRIGAPIQRHEVRRVHSIRHSDVVVAGARPKKASFSVTFYQHGTVNMIIDAKRRYGNLLNSQLSSDIAGTDASIVYINAMIPKPVFDLYCEVRKWAHANNIKRVWTDDGKIFIRLSDESQRQEIYSGEQFMEIKLQYSSHDTARTPLVNEVSCPMEFTTGDSAKLDQSTPFVGLLPSGLQFPNDSMDQVKIVKPMNASDVCNGGGGS